MRYWKFSWLFGLLLSLISSVNDCYAQASDPKIVEAAKKEGGEIEAYVTLRVQGDTIHLEIGDNGHGLATTQRAASPSLGVVGMRARARQLGGELSIQNRSGGGLLVQVEVPLQRIETAHAEQEHPSFVG